MDISVSHQAYMFLVMVVCGVFCGLVFDLFRSVRRAHNCRSGVVALQDIIFWLAELTLVYTVAFKLNYAKVRAYELFALVIGSVIYFMTVSFYVVRFLSGVFVVIIKAGKFITKPFAKLFGRFCKKAVSVKSALVLRLKSLLKGARTSFEGAKSRLVKKTKKMKINN